MMFRHINLSWFENPEPYVHCVCLMNVVFADSPCPNPDREYIALLITLFRSQAHQVKPICSNQAAYESLAPSNVSLAVFWGEFPQHC